MENGDDVGLVGERVFFFNFFRKRQLQKIHMPANQTFAAC